VARGARKKATVGTPAVFDGLVALEGVDDVVVEVDDDVVVEAAAACCIACKTGDIIYLG